MKIGFNKKNLLIIVIPFLTIVIVLAGMRVYLDYSGNRLQNEFMAQNYAELERSDMAALSLRLNGMISVASIKCVEGVRRDFVFFRWSNSGCKSHFFNKTIVLDRESYGGVKIKFIYSLPIEFYGAAVILLLLEFFLLWIYSWASSAIEKERQTFIRSQELQRHETIAQTSQMIAHDLKNPIFILKTALDSTSWEDFNRNRIPVNIAMRRMLSMIDALRQADLESIIRPLWNSIQWTKIANEMQPIANKKSTLNLASCVDAKVHVDLPKVERAIMNLISNAIEAGAQNIWLASELVGMDMVIKVSDDGPGVPTALGLKLFEHGTTFGKKDGTGLGLSFVRKTAEGHGGYIEYNRIDNRSEFSIFLPKVARACQEKVESSCFKATENSIINSNENPQVNEQKEIYTKITISLVDAEVMRRVIKKIQGEFPSLEISNSLELSCFVWSNHIETIKSAVQAKIGVFALGKSDSFEDICSKITSRLVYFT